ncbi:MAG TPA: biotin/lipoyl-containing protein, partial [Enhygromyxa sp.]|nr:biotin/lipoyl-containing protein [Enhygromyxa sp.]
RLQVEHPVTELVTGLDLVEWQLEVAAGAELPLVQEQVILQGHAIEVRLYAEDPSAGYLPQTGEILAWRPAELPGFRVDHGLLVGVARGQRIGSDYDPMVAKLIAHGATREQARRRLLLGLHKTALLGPTHNKQFLRALLEHPAFVGGEITIDFVESSAAEAALNGPSAPASETAKAVAAVLWLETLRDHSHPRPGVPVAWHSAHRASSTLELRSGDTVTVLELLPTGGEDGRPSWLVLQKGAPELNLRILENDGLALRFEADGHHSTAHYAWTADGELQLELDGSHTFAEHRPHEQRSSARDGSDGNVRAPTMGRVLALRVAVDQAVELGAPLLTLEAMKIESVITAPVAGRITEIRVKVGDQVDKAQLLIQITPTSEATP